MQNTRSRLNTKNFLVISLVANAILLFLAIASMQVESTYAKLDPYPAYKVAYESAVKNCKISASQDKKISCERIQMDGVELLNDDHLKWGFELYSDNLQNNY